MKAKKVHDWIMGIFLVASAVELIILPLLKVWLGHAVLPWLQK